jgi:UDP-glucose 4-epimerase
MNVLVTGGAGYIGSHTVIELLNQGYNPVIVDNLSNSSIESIKRIKEITSKDVDFYKIDVCNEEDLDKIFSQYSFDSIIHFAGLKSVGESVSNPLKYYKQNIISTLSLLEVAKKNNVNKIIFSSSATVYGTPSQLPIRETDPVGVNLTNPYGKTKYFIEEILRDYALSEPDAEITILRYFNPIGAHESGLIGEDPNGIPNNLLPFISQVAVGKLEKLKVFGDDYETVDGTGVRDYIHVSDLARGHIAALEYSKKGCEVYNLGTGRGVSVLELLSAFSTISGVEIPYEIVPRRAGDVGACFASAKKAEDNLKWIAKKSLEDACRASWHWQSKNPNGFSSK